MKKEINLFIKMFAGSGIHFVCLILLLSVYSKNVAQGYPKSHATQDSSILGNPFTTSWNVLFRPGTSDGDKNLFLSDYLKYLDSLVDAYNRINHKDFSVKFFPYCCPCDPLLCNYNFLIFNATGGSGGSVNPPPKPPGGGGSGDLIKILKLINLVAKNNWLDNNLADTKNEYIDSNKVVLAITKPIDLHKIIGIMDTGLDPSYFDGTITPLLWKDKGQPTIANFLVSPVNLQNGFDDHIEKHGTAVTALILNNLKHAKQYPRFMILKVLDNNKQGTTFSVSCALSYAIQKHVTLVNASLGYYGEIDSILRRYLIKAKGINVLAAAGNTPGPHGGTLCGSGTNNHLGATTAKLFYPACFSRQMTNVISVTSISSITTDCKFQNYSKKFVSIGVLNIKESCCKFSVPFLNAEYEGTSFATPIVTGKMMTKMINSGSLPALSFAKTDSRLNGIIHNGTYVESR
jgi:hypothetical protein